MYERILLATDGSENADRAAAQAISLAEGLDATLHALYVIETRTAYDNAIVDVDTVRENLRVDGEAALVAVRERVEAAETDLDYTTTIRRGVPAEEILTYVEEHDIGLVIMGATGQSAFKTVLLGSATEAVLRSGSVPILVVDGHETKRVRP